MAERKPDADVQIRFHVGGGDEAASGTAYVQGDGWHCEITLYLGFGERGAEEIRSRYRRDLPDVLRQLAALERELLGRE